MPYAGGDRIKETCSNPGASAFVLTGAVVGEAVRAFSSAEDGKYLRYVAKHAEAAEAEIGAGLYTHSTRTLTRRHRSYPSEGAGVVPFSSGVVHVANTPSVRDVVPWEAATDPTANDDVDDGHLAGNEWFNTSSGAVFRCVDPSPGAAVWVRIDRDETPGTGDHTHDAADITTGEFDPDLISAAAVTQHEAIIAIAGEQVTSGTLPDARLSNTGVAAGTYSNPTITFDAKGRATAASSNAIGLDAAPTTVTSNAATFALADAARLHNNADVESHQASVDFEVPAAAAAPSRWLIRFMHDGCTVSVVGNVGSVNGVAGGSSRGVQGGSAIVLVDSNPGSAPVVEVIGNIIKPPVTVSSTKTYDNDDHERDYELDASSGTQTFGATATYEDGFYVNIFNTSGGNRTIDGADADVTLANNGVLTVKKLGTKLIAFGSGGTTVLDAA